MGEGVTKENGVLGGEDKGAKSLDISGLLVDQQITLPSSKMLINIFSSRPQPI